MYAKCRSRNRNIKKYVTLFKQGKKTIRERKLLLEEQRNKLLEKQKNINATLDRLNYKIKWYEDMEQGKTKDFMEKP